MPIVFLLIILVVSVIGLVSSYYLYRHQRHATTVHCIVGHECDDVLHSEFKTFRGIKNERWGVIYFTLNLVLTIFAFFTLGAVVKTFFFFSSLMAGVFGLYLINIQLRQIKHSCTWCLIPTLSAVVILLTVLGLIFA